MRIVASIVLAGSVGVAPALGADTGSVCVHQYAPGRECTGNEVRIARIAPVSLVEDCASGDPGTAQAVFRVWVSAGAASQYDIGLFVALDGGSALSGANCLHDYLEPPLETSPAYGDVDGNGRPDLSSGPWWNGEPFDPVDDCGDLEGGTDAIKTLISVRFACADSNLDGIVDFSTCSSWSAGTTSHCTALGGAVPGGNPRCGCNVVETGVPMPGAAVASGRVAGLTVARDGSGGLLLAWAASCTATDDDYAVYEGTLGDFTSHASALCSTGGATSATVQPGTGDRYYLVVPRSSQREGSYGTSGGGAERPPATSACVPQLAQGCS